MCPKQGGLAKLHAGLEFGSPASFAWLELHVGLVVQKAKGLKEIIFI